MEQRNWQAKWITDGNFDFANAAKDISPSPLYFEKVIAPKGAIKTATVYCTALGWYDLLLDGKRINDGYFCPGFTDYTSQMQYQRYDVTNLLTENNRLGFIVAGGWACGSILFNRENRCYTDKQYLLCELEIEYQSGEKQLILTDSNWQVTANTPYLEADLYDGQVYDATADFTNLHGATEAVPPVTPSLYLQYGEPVLKHERFTPVFLHKTPSGESIYDCGQNFAGVVDFTINAKRGQKLIFRHAEVLIGQELYTAPLRTAKARVEYVCRDGEQSFCPTLTYMGFRYVGVTGCTAEQLKLSAYALYSDTAEIGEFECSDERINKLQSNVKWSAKSNFVDIPTDCPQRDERLGWTGDIAIFAETSAFNFDVARFLNKWLLDMRSSQSKKGGIPAVLPYRGKYKFPLFSSCWADSCTIVPLVVYNATGDKTVLETMYPVMKKYLSGVKKWAAQFSLTTTSRHIWKRPFHFGDWCAPDTDDSWIWHLRSPQIATAYWANSLQIAAHVSKLLGKTEDYAEYESLRARVCAAYIKRFTDGSGKLKKEFASGYVLPIVFNMTDEETKAQMVRNLVRLTEKSNYHIGTGFPATAFLLFALSDNGYTDVAYRLLLQDTLPSWLYEVKMGATTMWERWNTIDENGKYFGEGTPEMASHNHYAYGAVGNWLYKRVAGIDATAPCYRTFNVRPLPGGNLTYAKARTRCAYGEISSSWQIEKGSFSLSVAVPQGTEATVTLPDGQMHVCAGGRSYDFNCDLP